MVKKIFLNKSYIKKNQLWVLRLEDIKIPFKIKERSLVYILPKKFGGNHSHHRIEAFIGLGEGLEIWWKEKNILKKEKMNPRGKLYLFIVYSHCPHLIINNSDKPAIIFEFSDGIQKQVKSENLLEI